jgi:hypothetical protein
MTVHGTRRILGSRNLFSLREQAAPSFAIKMLIVFAGAEKFHAFNVARAFEQFTVEEDAKQEFLEIARILIGRRLRL